MHARAELRLILGGPLIALYALHAQVVGMSASEFGSDEQSAFATSVQSSVQDDVDDDTECDCGGGGNGYDDHSA